MLLALALAVLALPVQDSRADRLAALEKEYGEARGDYIKAIRAAKTDEEREKAKAPEPAFAPRFWEIARETPPDDTSVGALTWIVIRLRAPKDRDEALALVRRDHLKSPALVPLCERLGSMDETGAKLLEAILAANEHRAVRGHATYALASNRLPEAPREAEALLETVVKDFDDVDHRGRTLGKRARADLHEMRNLVVGKVAPEIEGEDLEGKAFKLSDYRGKVVLLDFWGHW